MAWQYTPYTLPLVLTGISLLVFAGYLWYIGQDKTTKGTTLASLLMLMGAEWVLAYVLNLSSTTAAAKAFWVRFEFIGIVSLPVVWLAYVLWYTDRSEWLNRRVFGAVGAIQVVFFGLVATNEYHHLIYQEIGLATVNSFVVFDPVYGIGFAAYLAYAYLLLFVSFALLSSAFVQARGIFRWQISVLLVFSTVPGIAGLLYVSGANPIPGLNIAALSNVVTAIAGGVALIRFKWMDVTPIARDSVLDAMNEAVLVVDPDDRIVDINTSAERLFATDSAAAIGRQVSTVIPAFASIDLEIVGEEREKTIETAVGERVFEVTISEIAGVPGDRTGYTILLHDITVRKRTTDQLREQRENIEQSHATARELAAARTTDEVHQLAVDGAVEILDCEVSIIAIKEGELLTPTVGIGVESVEDFPSVDVRTSYGGQSIRTDQTIVIGDLTDTRSAASAANQSDLSSPPDPSDETDAANASTCRSLLCVPLGDYGVLELMDREPDAFSNHDEKVANLLASHVETALDRVTAEEELRQERDRLDEFASVVSHDLRNPLNVAQGRLDLVLRDSDNDHLDTAYNALLRMETLIEDVLTLARQGEMVGEVARADLENVVTRAWGAVETNEATLDVADDLPVVEIDDARMCELFENLFRNAVEHAGPEVTITVGSMENGFYVADDGPGIDSDDVDHIFESGYTTTRDGTGFGLAIVKRIAEAHGWGVSVANSETGGARFEFQLH